MSQVSQRLPGVAHNNRQLVAICNVDTASKAVSGETNLLDPLRTEQIVREWCNRVLGIPHLGANCFPFDRTGGNRLVERISPYFRRDSPIHTAKQFRLIA